MPDALVKALVVFVLTARGYDPLLVGKGGLRLALEQAFDELAS
jgi:hypothetical protein